MKADARGLEPPVCRAGRRGASLHPQTRKTTRPVAGLAADLVVVGPHDDSSPDHASEVDLPDGARSPSPRDWCESFLVHVGRTLVTPLPSRPRPGPARSLSRQRPRGAGACPWANPYPRRAYADSSSASSTSNTDSWESWGNHAASPSGRPRAASRPGAHRPLRGGAPSRFARVSAERSSIPRPAAISVYAQPPDQHFSIQRSSDTLRTLQLRLDRSPGCSPAGHWMACVRPSANCI